MGANGEGEGYANPPLAGQPAAYLAEQLERWRYAERRTDPGHVMLQISQRLTPPEAADPVDVCLGASGCDGASGILGQHPRQHVVPLPEVMVQRRSDMQRNQHEQRDDEHAMDIVRYVQDQPARLERQLVERQPRPRHDARQVELTGRALRPTTSPSRSAACAKKQM